MGTVRKAGGTWKGAAIAALGNVAGSEKGIAVPAPVRMPRMVRAIIACRGGFPLWNFGYRLGSGGLTAVRVTRRRGVRGGSMYVAVMLRGGINRMISAVHGFAMFVRQSKSGPQSGKPHDHKRDDEGTQGFHILKEALIPISLPPEFFVEFLKRDLIHINKRCQGHNNILMASPHLECLHG